MAMALTIEKPEYLRMRAADMRGRADRAVWPETKRGLLRIADDFEVLANRAEQRNAWWSAKNQYQDYAAAVEAPVVETDDEWLASLARRLSPNPHPEPVE